MDGDTERLMLAMARRARSNPAMAGHAVARWEAMESRRAQAALGVDGMAMARICMTPMPTDRHQVAALCADTGCDPLLLDDILGGRT